MHSNFWCRYDNAGGTAAHRETDEGYCTLFKVFYFISVYIEFNALKKAKPGISRTPAQTVRTIKRQIWAACTGIQEAVDHLQTSTGIKDKTALFWIDQLIIKARETQKQRFSEDPRLKDKNLKGDKRKAVKTKIKDLIQWELYNWVILQPQERYSKLPANSCKQINSSQRHILIILVGRHSLRPGDHYNILLRVRGEVS